MSGRASRRTLEEAHAMFERHGSGAASSERRRGQGVLFEAGAPLDAEATRAGGMPLGLPDLGGLLLVEDDPDLREALAATLEDEGYAVSIARDGWEALERMALQRPAAILLDLMLPRMSGWQFLAEARARFPLHLPAVVLLSAIPNLSREAERLRAQDFVTKPIDPEEVLAAVRRCLGRARLN